MSLEGVLRVRRARGVHAVGEVAVVSRAFGISVEAIASYGDAGDLVETAAVGVVDRCTAVTAGEAGARVGRAVAVAEGAVNPRSHKELLVLVIVGREVAVLRASLVINAH